MCCFATGLAGAPAAMAAKAQQGAQAPDQEVQGGQDAEGDAGAEATDPVQDYQAAGAGAVTEEGAPQDVAASAAETAEAVDAESRHDPAGVPELTVLPIHNAAGRPFDLAVGRHLMEGLVNATHLTPLPATRAMVAKMHPRPQDLHLPKTLTSLGQRLHVPYVLVVEAVGKPRPTHVFIGLVEVRTGVTLLAYRAKMPRGTLSPELGLDLASRVRAALRHPDRLRHLAQAKEAARTGKASPEPEAAEAAEAPEGGEGRRRGRRGAEADAEAAPADDAAQDTPTEAEPSAAAGDELPHPLLDKGRVYFALQMTQRVSRLNVNDVDGASAPNYAGTKNNSNPFFPSLHLGGEVFSSAITGKRRRPVDNVGIRADVGLAPVRSYVKDDAKSTIFSAVVRLEADALYRQLWLPKRGLSPDVTLGVGISYYAFPLKNAAYPGVAYLAPDLRLDLNFPVHKNLGLFANVAVRPGMTPGSDARKVLGTPGKGLGLMFGVGLRGHYKLLEGEVRARVESFGANFTGTTSLPSTATGASGTAVQFQNAKLRDSLKEIVVQLGVVF